MPASLSTVLAIVAVCIVCGLLYWMQRRKNGGRDIAADFTTDLTALAEQGKLNPVVGVDESIERVLHVLARKQKNNPLLIGEPGVGKTAIVEGLAQRIYANQVPAQFRGKRILALRLADVMAGTKFRGDLEARFSALLRRLEEEESRIILFVDELHMIEQARGTEGGIDIADILKPALTQGLLHVIGATTWKEYHKHLRPDQALDRRFQPVLVEEPSRETAITILNGVKETYESFHRVKLPNETIEAAVDAAIRWIPNRSLPDKAFDVIDEACAKVSLETAFPVHAASLGLVHEASRRAREVSTDATPSVSPEDVRSVAIQWTNHRPDSV